MKKSASRRLDYFIRAKFGNLDNFKKYINQNSNDEYIEEFISWQEEMEFIAEEYLSYLDFLELDFKDSNCAELDKNEFDTIVKPFETKIITSFADEITGVDKRRLINGSVIATEEDDEKIHLLLSNAQGIKIIPETVIDTYMTQNPLSIGTAFNMANIHNKGIYNLILGFYGNNHDKDKAKNEEKIKILESFLKYDYNIDYETNNDHYFYVISTAKNKVLKKEKVKEKVLCR